MDNTEFTAEQIGNQAQLNAMMFPLSTMAYLQERGASIEDWATFIGTRVARMWESVKERGSRCDEFARIVALNMVSTKGTLLSLSGDETHAEVVIAWPPKDMADYWGLRLEDAQMLTNCFAPIADYVGVRFDWQTDGEQVKLAFSRQGGSR